MAEKSMLKETAVSQLGVSKLRPGTLQVTVRDISAKDLHTLLDRIIDLNGCRTCGLSGIDIYLRDVEPILFDRFADIESVRDVTMFR